MHEGSIEKTKAMGLCVHGNFSPCQQCELEKGAVPNIEGKDRDLPVMSMSDYENNFHGRSKETPGTSHFDFQGYVKSADGREDYKDVIITNGIGKAGGHDGIHLGIEGMTTAPLSRNPQKRGPESIDTYEVFIEVPAGMQRPGNTENPMVFRLQLDPSEDPQARLKAEYMHQQIVKFLEEKGPDPSLSEVISDLDEKLAGMDEEQFRELKK